MNILFIYPKYPDTFWSFKYAIKFISKKAVHPPLGLLTVAAMLPVNFNKKLVDMNVETLRDKDIKWADYVFLGAMEVQRKSAIELIKRCKDLGVKVVAGGPLFTSSYADFGDVDHFVLNEAEITLKPFLDDLGNGVAKRIYQTDEHPEITNTPVPLWELIKMKKYVSMNLQYSRGCPFNCEFCDITNLFGRKVRTKSKYQLIAELESLYSQGWRGNVFLVDDNFIGGKTQLKKEILPAITDWMKRRKRPFIFSTEVSINIADDKELMKMMVSAGFDVVFIGIETPNEASLAECGKIQNKNRDLIKCVKLIQHSGLEVTGGFIIGFDNDKPSIFKRQIEFIQNSGIVTAMVGLLNAPRNTDLYKRLKRENRLLSDCTGNNTDYSINFVPKMNKDVLINGYRNILSTIYSPSHYYKRIKTLLREYKPKKKKKSSIKVSYIFAFMKSVIKLGVLGKERFHYWKLLFWTVFVRPKMFPLAVTLSIYGYHFRKTLGIEERTIAG
ncbi:B12-binding domain-containing radical SAM protein [bacterium]|nr:B12-binding domain-containing radical SAM protein [bacterium]